MRKISIIVTCLLAISFFISHLPIISRGINTALAVENTSGHKKLVLIILDQINIEDLAGDYPNIHQLINEGALGLMNIRTAGRYKPANGYLTIGAGIRGVAPGAGDMILSSEEIYQGQKASKVFANFTGKHGNANDIFVLNISEILAENSKQEFEIIPGLLGEKLKKYNVPITFLGNADTPTKKNRLGALIAMDAKGLVAYGQVGQEVLIKDENAPFFISSNYQELYQQFLRYRDVGGLLVLQLGDTVRADNYAKYVSNERHQYFRKKVLQDADKFIGRISKELDFEKDLLMLVTPFPSYRGYQEKNLLTPFILTGHNLKQGFAISATTRRSGIVANIDIAPTILSFFEIPVPTVMLGHAIETQEANEVFPTLLKTNKQLVSTYIQRAYLVKPYVALQIFISVGFLMLILFRKNWLKYIKPVILAGIAVPIVFLVLTKVASNDLWSKYQWLFILTVLLVIVARAFNSTINSIIFLTLLSSASILLDIVYDSPLMKTSVLGYDPIGGSRYYGLGNEYMGVLIGALVIGLMLTLDRIQGGHKFKYIVFLIMAGAFYLIMSPGFGSNVGGTISAFGAFLTVMLLISNIKLSLKHVLYIALGILFTLAVLFFIVAPHGPPSHISQTVEVVKEGGLNSVFIIIGRKLTMNYKLFKYTVWTRGLLTFIVVILALLYRPPYLLKKVFQKYHNFYYGAIGTGVGCLLALCFNDSGIVAAATMMIYITLPILLLVIDEI